MVSNVTGWVITQEKYSVATAIADHATDFTFVFMNKNASAEETLRVTFT
jgi:hypothetical protein